MGSRLPVFSVVSVISVCVVLSACSEPHSRGAVSIDAGNPETTPLPAFPGAEGFGSTTPGGRGGRVWEVTTLEDSGAGSLRAALEAEGPRTIVFRTGGTIRLQSHLRIRNPWCTIAGQTAPGDGILIRDAGLYIETHDVIVRNLRVRIGRSDVEKYDTQDALHIEGPGAHDIVIDHCSFSWSIDEVVGVSAGAHDVTISWCIIAEPLDQPFSEEEIGKKRSHAYAVMLGGTPDRVSFHHNLVLHSAHRNPRVQGGLHDIRNNVIYNWGYFTAVFSRDPRVNFVGNCYKPGPESRIVAPVSDRPGSMGRIYVSGNLSPLEADAKSDDWDSVCVGEEEEHRAERPFPVPAVTTTPARVAFREVLAGAGARCPRLDPVDRRLLDDVRNGTGQVIDLPEEVGGFPELDPGTAPPDTDADGLPDAWEAAHALAPGSAESATGQAPTSLERYLDARLQDCLP